MSPILVIDGLNVFMRHFAANPSTSENGEHVGGVVGFLRGLRHLVNLINPKEVIIVWEGGGSCRRRAIDKNYKNNRRPVRLNRWYDTDDMPSTVENRNYQVNLLIKFLRMGPVRQLYISDCEADDVIGYLSAFHYNNEKIVIVSSDKDYYQLVNNRVKIWSPGQKKFITPETVVEKFGVSSNNFCAARCFCGDSSDGISGAKGVGFRTLAKRFPLLTLSENQSVDDIVNVAVEMRRNSKLKIYENVVEYAIDARRNWKLMYLGTNNLAATQIQQIKGQCAEVTNSSNKLNFMRLLIKHQMINFDVNSYYMSLNSIKHHQ
jgi:DNA polymerase-1